MAFRVRGFPGFSLGSIDIGLALGRKFAQLRVRVKEVW